MRASYLGSKSMLKAFAEAHERKVPDVRKRNVNVEVERVVLLSAIDVVDDNRSDMGYREYADVVVRRIKKESRGFESDRYVANFLRHTAVCGRAAAVVASLEEASKGNCSSFEASVMSCAAFFCCQRRRCGAILSSPRAAFAVATNSASSVLIPAAVLDSGVVDTDDIVGDVGVSCDFLSLVARTASKPFLSQPRSMASFAEK